MRSLLYWFSHSTPEHGLDVRNGSMALYTGGAFPFHHFVTRLSCIMALVRILVDGYSLLHSWREIAPGQSRFSAAARDELIWRLTLYQDTISTPITIFFDGASPKRQVASSDTAPGVEVLYSHSGQTADQMIERATHRFATYGEVLAVTDDNAERETVISLGGLSSSCSNFIQDVENTLAEQADDIKDHNRRERHRFRNRR